jgi:hypothetical protein
VHGWLLQRGRRLQWPVRSRSTVWHKPHQPQRCLTRSAFTTAAAAAAAGTGGGGAAAAAGVAAAAAGVAAAAAGGADAGAGAAAAAGLLRFIAPIHKSMAHGTTFEQNACY